MWEEAEKYLTKDKYIGPLVKKYGRCKIKPIKDLAQRVKGKKLQIKKLNVLPDDEVMGELVAVKGIGRWTAEMFLMFSLGRVDIFPDDDLGIRKGFLKVVGKNFNEDKMVKFALRWKPYRTVASWYIWRTLE